jgi:hypothetical protein
MALNEDVVASVANTNFKVIADQPALASNQLSALANMALQNAISFQQGMNSLFATGVGKMMETLVTIDPSEGVSSIGLAQALLKGSMTVPPVSAPGPVAS